MHPLNFGVLVGRFIIHWLYIPYILHMSALHFVWQEHTSSSRRRTAQFHTLSRNRQKQFRGITHVILFILCSIFNTSSTTSISHPVATAQPYHNPVQKPWDKSFLGVQYSKKLGWGWNALAKAFFVFMQFTGIVSRLAGLWKDIQSCALDGGYFVFHS